MRPAPPTRFGDESFAVAARSDATSKAELPDEPPAPREREALPARLAASTQELLGALREAGPERGCWAWWGKTQPTRTCTAAARRRLHEIAVHTFDAQLTTGAWQPVPVEVALDGVEEFLTTICTTTHAWPHEPAAADHHATEGRSWRHRLSEAGCQVSRRSVTGADAEPALASIGGTPNELLHGL